MVVGWGGCVETRQGRVESVTLTREIGYSFHAWVDANVARSDVLEELMDLY